MAADERSSRSFSPSPTASTRAASRPRFLQKESTPLHLLTSLGRTDRVNPPQMASGVTEALATEDTFSRTGTSSWRSRPITRNEKTAMDRTAVWRSTRWVRIALKAMCPGCDDGLSPMTKSSWACSTFRDGSRPASVNISNTDSPDSESNTQRWNVLLSVKSRPSDPSKRTQGRSMPFSRIVARALAGRRAVAASTVVPPARRTRRAARVSGCTRPCASHNEPSRSVTMRSIFGLFTPWQL